MRYTSREIIKLIDTLIGKVEPIGETNIDNESFENLKLLIDVTNWCLDGLQYTAKHRHDNEYSCVRAGQQAAEALMDYQTWIEDILDE